MDNINTFANDLKKSRVGELFSSLSHLLGALVGIVGLVLMLVKAEDKTFRNIFPIVIYGSGLILLFSFSSIYHFFPLGKAKKVLRKFDHISIYVFIAATYTPICLFSLPRNIGLLILIVIWACAFVGFISNTIIIYKSAVLTIVLYIAMGWIMIFAIKPLTSEFDMKNLMWLIWGGIFYTIGALLYALGKRFSRRTELFTHDVFHIFVLAGAFSHYWFIYSYVI